MSFCLTSGFSSRCSSSLTCVPQPCCPPAPVLDVSCSAGHCLGDSDASSGVLCARREAGVRSGGLRFSDIGHACLQSVPFDTGYAGPNGVEPQSYVNGNGTSYIYFGSGQFDGQGSGHDFNGTVSLLSRMTPQKQGIGGSSSVSPEPLETIMGMRRMLQLRTEEDMGLGGMKPRAWHSTLQIELDLDAKNTC